MGAATARCGAILVCIRTPLQALCAAACKALLAACTGGPVIEPKPASSLAVAHSGFRLLDALEFGELHFDSKREISADADGALP